MAAVLLIDDDVDLVQMNQAVLEFRGHEVRTAHSAAEARKVLEGGYRPEVAVLDVMMESHTAGFELAREIHERFPEMRTLMLSGVVAATGVPFRFEPDATWLPVLKFLDKPIEPDVLADEVEALLKSST